MSHGNLTDSINKSVKAPTKRTDSISSEPSIPEPDEDDDISKKEVYEKQMSKLEEHIDELRREVDEIQKKIAIIYEYRKSESKEERNYYKESNINEATYIDSLTSAANLCNELNIHKRKLDADLQKYKQSIEIQEERKRDVYKILMNYKQELLMNAEYKKGTKIPTDKIEEWLNEEKYYEDEVTISITFRSKTLELQILNYPLSLTG
jgi:chromosome segregation ATPase